MAMKSAQRSFDLLWKDYFRDPSQWWDHSHNKIGPAYPDFKHKVTKESLWIDGRYNPSWVAQELRQRRPQTQDAEICEYKATAFVALLRSCAKRKDLRRGTRLHEDILQKGLLEKCSNSLVTMYAKCGALSKANALLHMHKITDVFSWTALITGYAQQGQGQNALNCFEQMRHHGLSPDAVTYSCILKACGNVRAMEKGEQIHDEIAKQGLLAKDIVLGNALVDMYAKCGALTKAQEVLEDLPSRDVVSWNALIAGHAQQCLGEQALKCFERMRHEGVSPNAVTFVCVLKAYGSIGPFDKGEHIHNEISRQGLLENHIVLGNALVDMYAKCGALTKARQLLEELPVRDVVSWNVLITAYAQLGQSEQALMCFERMQQEALSPDAVTISYILKACSSIGATDKGEQIHDEMARQGYLGNRIMLGTALVDMHAKCGALVKARQVLEELPVRDVVSWSALITGYAQQGKAEQVLYCFKLMQHEGLSPDAMTFSCVLEGCGSIETVDKGEQIHDEIARQGLLGKDIVLGNALVYMYSKSGALMKARQVLEELPVRDVVSWSALISGYAQHGQGEHALNCFEHMQDEGLYPNAVTFSCVLNACSRLGLVVDAQTYFLNMSRDYGMGPHLEHYTCMVDLYGRAGQLDKAVGIIQKMPLSDRAVWSALLGACWKWGDVTVGKWAFEHAVQIDKSDAAAYVLMANIYAAAGMQEHAANIEAMRIENTALKKPEQNQRIGISGCIHPFLVP